MYTDLMLDLETLSSSPTAAIIQIGAVAFNRDTGEIDDEPFKINTRPDLESYDVSLDTIDFWLQQSDAARASILGNRSSLNEAMNALRNYAYTRLPTTDAKGNLTAGVWALPASFDLPILENAMRKEGVTPPWHYSCVRCCRTAFDLAGITKQDRTTPESLGLIAHDAVADCIAQICTLRLALGRLNNKGK